MADGCQAAHDSGLLATPLATPVLVKSCQCPSSGPEASWHSPAVPLLSGSLSLQTSFADFLLTASPGPGLLLNLSDSVP